MNQYFYKIWKSRYFWTHLALSDLRAKWRRSFFGIFWSMLQPLGMASLLAFIFSRLFHTDLSNNIPYIFSGIIFWEFISVSLVGGCLSFVQADAYIKQCQHPLAIYSLRSVLAALIVFLLATTPLLIWSFVLKMENFGWSWLSLLTLYPIVILMIWPLTSILAYIGSRFRDLPPLLALILQALWFISPVYFEDKMFRSGGLDGLIDYNPVYHVLQIIRAPLLHGNWPTVENYMFCIFTTLVLIAIAIFVGAKVERKVIFYL